MIEALLRILGARGSQRVAFAGGGGGALLLSMRDVADLVGYCAEYELEDVVAGLTGADVARPGNYAVLEASRRAYRLARMLTGSGRVAAALAPRPGALRLERSYDLFFPVFNHPWELFALSLVPGWRERCRRAACYITEVWHEVPEYLVELLRPFDHVFLGMKLSVERVARLTGRPCSYLPLGVDALSFCPLPRPPARAIHVCGIGRRSPVTHRALLAMARERGTFYYYDTVRAGGFSGKQMTFSVSDPGEHRLLLAGLLKRSRYFIANRARANDPEVTLGADEIAGRFFEGTAAGAVLLGVPPQSEEFRRLFGWEDAVVPIPFDAPDIAEVIARLDADPARLARIRRENAAQALLKHDWVHRFRAVLEAVGLEPGAPVREREALLAARAEEVRRADLP